VPLFLSTGSLQGAAALDRAVRGAHRTPFASLEMLTAERPS